MHRPGTERELARTHPSAVLAAIVPGLDELWRCTRGVAAVRLAVVDGPVHRRHACLVDANLELLEGDLERCELGAAALAHGTHVTSMIFGQPESPLHGIAPACAGLIAPIFRCDSRTQPRATQEDLARALVRVVEAGAHVVNVSAGELTPKSELEPALARALELCTRRGVAVVAATGNEGCACAHVPAAASVVLAVGAHDVAGVPTRFSNWGAHYAGHALIAPGEEIPGARLPEGVESRSGTSYATAIVSGVLGLLLSLEHSLGRAPDPLRMRELLLATADGCAALAGVACDRLLSGRMNLSRALRELRRSFPVHRSVHATRELLPAKHERNTMTENTTLIDTPQSFDPFPRPPENPVARFEQPLGGDGMLTPQGAGGCGCTAKGEQRPTLVYALGQLDVDFVSEARRDSFTQALGRSPHDHAALAAFLTEHPAHAAELIWVLKQEVTPLYAIVPVGPFASTTFARLCDLLSAQSRGEIERISVPGVSQGDVRLLGGSRVPGLVPDARGLYAWTTQQLVEQLVSAAADKAFEREHLANFLERIYYELRNRGASSRERALNFSASNAFQAHDVFQSYAKQHWHLEAIDAEPSPFCREGSDCWDVKLTFFDPTNDRAARRVHRFTVDVSEVIPVTVGPVRAWFVR